MQNNKSILVWELPIRLFHWLLVLSFSFALITGLLADLDWMEWHMRAGYLILGLLIFRILLGLVGQGYGRFSQLALSLFALRDYLRSGRNGSGSPYVGHNPMGSWMVVVMLVAILLQVISGFMTTDDIFLEGPWVVWAADDWISLAGTIHSQNYWLLIAMVSLHLLAILFYECFKKQRLVKAMFIGRKVADANAMEAEPTAWWLVCLTALVAVGLTLFLIEM